MQRKVRAVAAGCIFVWLFGVPGAWGQETGLTRPEMREFLLSAEVIASRETGSGTTRPSRLTLSDGQRTHDALFQTIDEQATVQCLGRTRELNFVDAYRYNIAAYELADLIGLGQMIPVAVERVWGGKRGSLSCWIDDVMFDEATRRKERQWPEDMARWMQQQTRVLVFAELVYDTDRNQTNQLYTSDWTLYMIDFSRAFRLWDDIRRPDDLIRIDSDLFARLRTLTEEELEEAAGAYLSDSEVSAVLKRRDLLIKHFQQLIDDRGAAMVLY